MKYIGHCGDLPVAKGDVVEVPSGVKVRTTHPQRDSYVSKRKQKVTINHILNGYSENTFDGERHVNPSVVWAGAGGYWCEVDINDIVLKDAS